METPYLKNGCKGWVKCNKKYKNVEKKLVNMFTF